VINEKQPISIEELTQLHQLMESLYAAVQRTVKYLVFDISQTNSIPLFINNLNVAVATSIQVRICTKHP
jgi:hypothetical protein